MSLSKTRRYCWIPDEKNTYAIVEIVGGYGTEDYTVRFVDSPSQGPQSRGFSVKAMNTFPIDSIDELSNPPSDLIQLTDVHRPGILHTLQDRFKKDRVYTSIGPILIALNPFRWISGIYDDEIKMKYFHGTFNLSENPHVFAMAHDSLMGLQYGKNQSLIISGESGAGKTEATKQCLNYLAVVAGSSTGVHNRILQANPILESWGNAKTLRNNNSSRFGKFIEILMSRGGEIVGSSNTTYLLEKSRVVFQETGERSYHVFYQLLFGAPDPMISEFDLLHMRAHPDTVNYINQSGCLQIEGVDDTADYREVEEAQGIVGFPTEDSVVLLRMVAGILHLGNITFDSHPSNSEELIIQRSNENSLSTSAQLFGVDRAIFVRSLLYKSVRSGKRKSITYAPYNSIAAIENRDALAKEIYSRCFDFIVATINTRINVDPQKLAAMDTNMIGVLDIFGFEIFKKNSFEQLCINLANEALQRHFNVHIFQTEMEIYLSEDIVIPNLSYNDNQDVLDLIIKKPKGLIPMLDEEGQVPRGSWEGFLSKFTKQHVGVSKRLKYKPGAKFFTLAHYAGEVIYDPSLFIVKNKDTLSSDLVEVMASSSCPFLSDLFRDALEDQALAAGRASQASSKQTVGTKFRIQLDSLISTLNATSPKYIRCIKPNSAKKPGIFEPEMTNEQLTYSGVFEAVVIMQNGYPFRLTHLEFRNRYHMLALKSPQRLSIFGSQCGREELLVLGSVIGELHDSLRLCHIGKTMVFYRVEQHRILEEFRRQKVDSALDILQKRLRSFVIRNLYVNTKQAITGCITGIFGRDILLMQRSAESLCHLEGRFRDLRIAIQEQRCLTIALQYSEALEAEARALASLSEVMDESLNIFSVFDQLRDAVQEAQLLSFSATLNGHIIELDWRHNEIIVSAHERVQKYQKIIDIKHHLDRGILDQNEVALKYWLQILDKCRSDGEVESQFCREEEATARTTVKSAEQIFETFLSSAMNAITLGSIKNMEVNSSFRSFEEMINTNVSVDPLPLRKFLDDYDLKNDKKRGKQSHQVSSIQMDWLIRICRELAQLREYGLKNNWKMVWELLPVWINYTGPLKDSQGTSFTKSDSHVLPLIPQIEHMIRAEIKTFYICAVGKVKFSKLAEELKKNHVPINLTLSISPVDITPLLNIIDFLNQPDERENMSPDQLMALEYASIKGKIRDCILKGNRLGLRNLLGNPQISLPRTDDDSNLGSKWLLFYETIDDLDRALKIDGPQGTPGDLSISGVSGGSIQRVLQSCNGLIVHPEEEWKTVVTFSQWIRDIRSSWGDSNLHHTLNLIETTMKTPLYQQHLSETEGFSQFSEQMLESARTEIEVSRKEVKHLLAKDKILVAVRTGSVRGEVGALNSSLVEIMPLQLALQESKIDLILDQQTIQLIQDCEVLVTLRSCVMSGEWDYLLRITEEIYETTQGFKDTHDQLKSEFEVIYGEAQDLQARKRMITALQEEFFYLSENNELSCLEESQLRYNLEEAILFSRQQRRLSFEAQFLLSNSLFMLALRNAVRSCSWEESDLSLTGIHTEDLAISLTTQAKAWSQDEIKLKIEKLLSVGKREVIIDSNLNETDIIPIYQLLEYSRTIEIHECASSTIGLVRQAFMERKCRAILVLSACVDCITGSVEHLDNSSVAVETLSRAVSYVYMQLEFLSDVLKLWLEVAMNLLHFRLAVGDISNRSNLVDLSAYIEQEHLLRCSELISISSNHRHKTSDEVSSLSTLGFPMTELSLVVDHIFDCLSINALAEALHSGRPQFYNGKFDTKNVHYEHVISALEVAKKCDNISDHLDRLMFYADLCVNLRKAITNHKWDLSESGERTLTVDQSRGFSVKQCLLEYQQANKFFQKPIDGIPPKTLKDEFLITQREWERRLILQGFPSAFQTGRVLGKNGNLLLYDVKYQRLADQIERTRSWSEQTGVKDPDLDLLVKAGQEIVQVRRRALEVHQKYKREAAFRRPTNSIPEILESEFISDAIFNAIEKVEGLLVHPYPMNTEWKHIDQAVSKMEISGRIPGARMQVELLGTETFERSFNGNIVRTLHSLDEFEAIPPNTDDVKIILNELQNSCQSYRARSIELDSKGAIRPSKVSEFLFISSVVLIHLLTAETGKNYDDFDRDWLSCTKVPTLSSLSASLMKTEWTVQDILRTASTMDNIHPSVRKQIFRASRHVEEEITVMELTKALGEGKVMGSVGHILINQISISPLTLALDRAIMFAAVNHGTSEGSGVIAPKSRQWLTRSAAFLGNSADIFKYTTSRNSARFRYSSRFNANQVAMIEIISGFKDPVVYGGVGRVAYNQVTPDQLALALKRAETQTAYRSDVVRLRHTCEILYELRESILFRNYKIAFDILNENFGEEGQTFKDLLSSIYAANFAIHPLAIEEFSLIALEICESYWRFAAKGALIRGVVRGTRCCFHLSEVNCDSIDEVLGMIEGLVEISRESIVIRELCFMVKHLRKCTINAIISPEHEDSLYHKRKEPIPSLPSNKLTAIMKLGFVDNAIRNALLVVNALSPLPYAAIIQTNYAKFVTIENIVNHVQECITLIEEDNLVITHRNILLSECSLIRSYCHFYTVMLSLEKILNIEMIWFSFSTSRLEIDANLKSLLENAVSDAISLNLNPDIPAEKIWWDLLQLGIAFQSVVSLIEVDPNEAKKCVIGSEYCAGTILPSLKNFLLAYDRVKMNNFSFPQSFQVQQKAIASAVQDHESYSLLLRLISDSEQYCVGMKDVNDNVQFIDLILEDHLKEKQLDDNLQFLQQLTSHSLICSIMKDVAMMHIEMRKAMFAKNWWSARVLSVTILREETLRVPWVEASLVEQFLSIQLCSRQLEQGILCCIFPPVIGWSGYSTATSLALSIVDFPLKTAIDIVSTRITEFEAFRNDQILGELFRVGQAFISLVYSIRRLTWGEVDTTSTTDRLSMVNMEAFGALFPVDHLSDLKQSISLSFQDIFQTDQHDLTVRSATELLKSCLLQSNSLSGYIRSYVQFMISSAEMELKIFDLSKIIKEAFGAEKVTGIPGQLNCSTQSIENINSVLRKLGNELSTIERSIGLRRSYQCLKIAKVYRTAVLKQDWHSLGPLIQLFQYMSQLDRSENENQCAELMHIAILDDQALLELSDDFFAMAFSETQRTLNEFSDSANRKLQIHQPTTEESNILSTVKEILGIDDLREILPSIPEMQEETTLLERHYYFEKACHIFADALQHTPASGLPGELCKNNIEYKKFYQVHELLRESGLLSYESGQQLFEASSAMIALRVGQRSGRLDELKDALMKCKSILAGDRQHLNIPIAPQKYLEEAAKEIELASLDYIQQECIHQLYVSILSNRLPLSGEAISAAALSVSESDMSSHQESDLGSDLSVSIRESQRKGVTCKRGQILMSTARLILNIRKNVLTRDWIELKSIFSDFDLQEKDRFDRIALEEVESARRLMIVSSAIEISREAINSNRIQGLVADIDLSLVSVSALERAKEEFTGVKSEWLTETILPYLSSTVSLIPVRHYAIRQEWSMVYDHAIVSLEKHIRVPQLTSNAVLEIRLAKEHAAYMISRSTLLDAICNGRLEGDIGEISLSQINSGIVEDALLLSQKLDVELPQIQRLEATARILFDLRCAQQIGKWMVDPLTRNSAARGGEDASQSLPDPDCMIVTESIVPFCSFDLKGNTGTNSKSLYLNRYLEHRGRSDSAAILQQFSVSTSEYGNIGWLIKNRGLDSDLSELHSSENFTQIHSVEEVLEGAAYVERALGIAEEAMPEIAFAQEELNYRQTVHMLLRAMSTAGFKGTPGKLDASEVDLYPLERAILFAESSPDICERGTCRSLLRDARILFQVRKFRSTKDWVDLNKLILNALNLSTLCPPLPPEFNDFGEEVQPEPMLPFVWNEISLIRADMYFYICLSEFAQEMTNRPNKDSNRDYSPGRKEETASLTSLLRTILKTKAAAETHPSTEFDRLLEAQHAALELRTHMTFDSTTSPRSIIANVVNTRERDKKNGVTSYISLLMPDISQLSNVLDTEQLVESLEKAILRDQGYLRCPIGHINTDEIDLDFIRISITSAMPFLNAAGSKEHLNLLSLATAILAIRTEIVARNWSRVRELIDSHESILNSHPTLVSEEITRLIIETENDEACEQMRLSLECGRLTNVLALVKKISRHRSASMSAIAPIQRANSIETLTSGRSLFSLPSRIGDSEESFLQSLDESIEKAIAVKHRSDITAGLLRASVLIRALRSAISTGDWDEVQQIVSEESNYTRMPASSIEEIRAAKAALHYRNCMSSLAKGLVTGAASGIPGKINISAVDFTTLQTSISQAEVLDISDPATAIVLEIGHRICALRQAVVASHWFSTPPTIDDVVETDDTNDFRDYLTEKIEERVARLRAASQTDIQIYSTVPFSNGSNPSDSLENENDSHSESGEVAAVQSVEELLAQFKKQMYILSDLRAILNMRTNSEEDSVSKSFDFDDIQDQTAEFDDSSRDLTAAPDWVEHQLEAIKSVLQEVKLLDTDLRERRRQELVVSALEKIPSPVRQFKTRTDADKTDGDQERDEQVKDIFYIRHLEKSINAAKSIKGEVPKETAKILRTAELILRFRKIMNSLEIDSFKQLLDEANMLSSRNLLSLHYGVYELNAYRSATLTVTLAKAELIKALKTGRVRGSLAKINTEEIEVESLGFWVSSCTGLMETTKELSMGLFDALQEAQIMLELRTHVKRDDWTSVTETLNKHSDLFYRFEFGVDEIRHIQFASKYRSVSATISDLVSDDLPFGKEEQCAYVLLKTDALERALQSAEAVMKYQSDLLTKQPDRSFSNSADNHRNMLTRLISQSIEEEEGQDSEDEATALEESANVSEFQLLCNGAKSVIRLWRAIRNKVWFEEQIASGQVHSLPRPKDPFFYLFLESLRQHEVSQRLGAIHDELRILKIDPEKKIRNIRQSIRTSFASGNRNPTFEIQQQKSQNLTQSTPQKVRRSSLSIDGSPAAILGYSQAQSKSPTVVSAPIAAPIRSRRKSLGSISGFGDDVLVFSSKLTSEEEESVAMILAGCDWLTLPNFATKQFIQARNILVDRVTKLRLTWGCQEGAAEEGNYGNISLANVNVDLLNVALADVRRIDFYTYQMTSKFSFSKDVQAHIRVANIILTLRKAVISDNVDNLVHELRLLNFLSGSRNFDLNLNSFPAVERELHLFERFAFECIAEKTVRTVIKFLCAVDFMRASLTRHPSILELKCLDKVVKPVGKVTQNYQHCVRVSNLLYQGIVSAVMCNQPRVRKCESDILAFLNQPDSPLGDLVRDIGKSFRMLFLSATIRALSDDIAAPMFEVKVDNMTSIQSARRRSILGQTRTRRLSMTTEIKSEMEPSPTSTLFTELEIESQQTSHLVEKIPSAELKNYSLYSNFKRNFISFREELKLSPPIMVHEISLNMYIVSLETISSLEKLYDPIENLLEGILEYSTLIDPMWVLTGQLILLTIHLSSKIIAQIQNNQFQDSLNLPSHKDKIILSSQTLVHPSIIEILSTLAAESENISINLPALSSFFTSICLYLQRLDSHYPQSEAFSPRRLDRPHRISKGREKSFLSRLHAIQNSVMAFKDNILTQSNYPNELESEVGTEWIIERTKRRCVSQCESLLKVVNSSSFLMKTSVEREKIQQEVKAAVARRKRQFT